MLEFYMTDHCLSNHIEIFINCNNRCVTAQNFKTYCGISRKLQNILISRCRSRNKVGGIEQMGMILIKISEVLNLKTSTNAKWAFVLRKLVERRGIKIKCDVLRQLMKQFL